MKEKIKKLIYAIGYNSRISSKELGKKIRSSQQSAHYLLNSLLKKKSIIKRTTMIDPAKFGLINIIVIYKYNRFDAESIRSVNKDLTDNPNITFFSSISQGGDLMVQYTVSNLSSFNKEHTGIIYSMRKMISVLNIYVSIVQHEFERKYLIRNPKAIHHVLSGDRDVVSLSKNQLKILKMLYDNPGESIVRMAESIKISPKTAVRIKKELESSKIIRKYSITIDYKKFGMTRSYLFLSLESSNPYEIDRLLDFAKSHRNIVGFIKVIGPFEAIIVFEKLPEDKSVTKEIRSEFNVDKYKIIECEEILKDTYVPKTIFEE